MRLRKIVYVFAADVPDSGEKVNMPLSYSLKDGRGMSNSTEIIWFSLSFIGERE